MNRLRALLLCLGLALLGTQAAKAQSQANPPTNLAQQVPGIPLEVQNNIRRFIQKSPTVAGFRTEVDFLEPSMVLPACPGGTKELGSWSA